MKKNYPNRQPNLPVFFIVLSQALFKRILLFMLFYLCSTAFISAQCNSEPPIPFIENTFGGLNATSSIRGICACTAVNEPRLIDADLNNFATAMVAVGAVGTENLRVTDANTNYPAGSYVGYKINTGGLLNVNLLGSITITTYLDGVAKESVTGTSLLGAGLLNGTNNDYVVGFNTKQSFDAIEISVGGLVSLVNTINVYYPVIRNYCAGPTLSCNAVTAMNLPVYPVSLESSHTGVSGVSVGNIYDAENVISSNTNDFATISLTAGVLATGNISVKDQLTDYPVGTYAGFEIENSNLLSVSALGNVTVTTYLDGVQKQVISGNNLVATGALLNSSGRYKVGFASTTSFDEVQISINQTVGVNLGSTKVYGAVFENFCAGPDLVCNTPTGMVAPTYPVYINAANTGVEGVACPLCSVKNAENLIDQVTSNYAEIDLSAGVLASGSISVKDQIKDYPIGSFVGFTVENPALLSVNALDAITITTYLNGVLQEIKAGNTALATVGTDLLVGTSPQTIGFTATKTFDEARITITNTASVNLGIVRVYQAVFEKMCPVTLECNKTYSLTNPTFPVIIDSNKTGVQGVACVSCAVNDTNNVLTASTTDFARIMVTAGVIAPVSIAVLDQLSTYPAGTFAGFTIRDRNSLLQLDLFNALTVSTYLDGVLQESNNASNLLNLSLLTPFGSGAGMYNVGFRATKSFDEIRISAGSLASVINDIDVFGAFVNTSGTSGGTLFCAVIDAVNDSFSQIVGSTGNSNAGNVLTNDTLSGNPATINDVNLTVLTPAVPLTVGALVPSIDATTGVVSVPAGTPAGTYTITYQICYKLNSLTCDTATVTVVVAPALIDAVNDANTATIYGNIGGDSGINVYSNDTLNGNPVNPSDVTFVSTPNGPLTVNTDGSVTVAPNTPAGTYTVTYQICEKLNPSNCDTATATVTVAAQVILANDDTTSINGYTGGTAPVNVLTNDTLNGNPVNPSDVTLTSTPNGPLTVNTDGSVTVAPNTPAGTYTVTYQICEKLNPSNCDTATVTVTVTAPEILANDDTTSINGYTGGTASINVLTNDTLNGNPVNPLEVTLTSTPNGPLTVNTDGSITVAPDTPAGTYTVTYQICEKLNPSNCDSATVTVTVTAPVILANDDATSIDGSTGGTASINVLTNDTLNGGAPVKLSEVTLTSTPNGPLTVNTDGSITVAPNTLAGTYTVTYQICEKLNPSNCDTATVTVTVTAPVILANDDNGKAIATATGGTAFQNVLGNDTLNGLVVNSSQVNTTLVSSTNPGITLLGNDVVVAAGTPVGNYTLTYQICEKLNTTNCDSAVVNVTVVSTAPAIVANNDSGTPVNGFEGGTAFTNVLSNDQLNGATPTTTDVTISFVSSTDSRITLSGTDVIVAAGTPAGTYSLDYQICDKLPTPNCDVARVTVTVIPAAILAKNDTGTDTNGHSGGIAFANVLTNDTLNGTAVTSSQVNITLVSSTNSGVTLSGTDVVVLPGTPIGGYTLTYQICEKLNPSNCSIATVTGNVTASVIVGVDDSTSVNGYTGGITPLNVLTNDTLNGNPVNPSEVNLIPVTNGPLSINSGGSITVAPNTPAQNYTITYQICEKLNSTNCDTATVTVTVTPPVILANDDTTSINGFTGGTTSINVLTNDTLNGNPVNPSEVTLIPTQNGPLTVNADGSITVLPNTAAGPYTVSYQICEKLNPSNCDTAIATVVVSAAVIDAVADTNSTPVYGNIGGNTGINVLANDTLNGAVVNPSAVTLTSTPNGPLSINPDGSVMIAPNTPAGTYTITYSICENLNSTNCDSATVTVVASFASIALVKTGNVVGAVKAGNLISYTFTVTNTGNTNLNGIVINDPLTNTVNLAIIPSTLAPNAIATATATYTIKQSDIDAGKVTNSATVTGTTPTGETVMDISGTTINTNTPTITMVSANPSIAVVKTSAVGGTGKVGDIVTYTFTVTNTGNSTLNNIVINDALTSSVNLAVTPSSLAPNTVGTATVNYTIKQSDIDAGKITNSATVSGTTPSGGTVTDISGTTITNNTPTVTTLTTTPSIAVVKTSVVGATIKVGDVVTYTFTVTNTGNTSLNNVIINDALTNTVNQAVTPSILLPNAIGTATSTYTIKQSDIDAGQITNSATVTGTIPTGGTVTDTSGTAINNDNPTITTLNTNPGISIMKEGTYEDKNKDGIANVGDVINYSFTVTNTGNVSLHNITLQDNNVTTVKGTLSSLSVGASDSVTFSAVYSITDADIVSGYVYNSAIVSALSAANAKVTAVSTDPTPCAQCPVLSTCLTCTITAIPQAPSIAIIKKGVFKDENEDGYAEIGETIDYTFTVMNTGNLPLTNVTLTDALPGIVITGGSINLAVGATDNATFRGTYRVTQQDIVKKSVTNQAKIKGITPGGVEVTDLSDDDSPLQDDPTVLGIDGCTLEVFNAVSPDGDGMNDIFRIRGIECYPKNSVQVFNRWGVKVYDAEGYNNDTVAFKGYSEGRVTVNKSEGLPSGTYFYVIKYEDFSGTGIDKSGYLNISRN